MIIFRWEDPIQLRRSSHLNRTMILKPSEYHVEFSRNTHNTISTQIEPPMVVLNVAQTSLWLSSNLEFLPLAEPNLGLDVHFVSTSVTGESAFAEEGSKAWNLEDQLAQVDLDLDFASLDSLLDNEKDEEHNGWAEIPKNHGFLRPKLSYTPLLLRNLALYQSSTSSTDLIIVPGKEKEESLMKKKDDLNSRIFHE